MLTSRVSGSGEVCGRAPCAISGAALRSVLRTASGMSSRSNRAMKVTGRPLSREQEVEQLELRVVQHADLARQRDLDRALAALAQRVAVGLQLLAAGVAAGQRPALKPMCWLSSVLEKPNAPASTASPIRSPIARGLVGVGRALHRRLAHDVMAERRQRREEGEVERRPAARGGVHDTAGRSPSPR